MVNSPKVSTWYSHGLNPDLLDANHRCRQKYRNQEMVDSGVRKLREKKRRKE